MARTSTVSAEQVAAAANTQLAQGTPPTARSVREQLGTGSMATILRHFQAWQATQSKPAPVVTTLPRELERILLDFTAQDPFHHFHGFFVRDTHTLNESALLADFL